MKFFIVDVNGNTQNVVRCEKVKAITKRSSIKLLQMVGFLFFGNTSFCNKTLLAIMLLNEPLAKDIITHTI